MREIGTEQIVRLASPAAGPRLAVLALARVEFRAAVRQRERKGDVSHDTAQTLIARIEEHFQNLYLIQLVTEAVLEEASALLDRHALRAYDAMQLAGCLALRANQSESPSFVCCDRQLVRAAEVEGLPVFDPVAEL